MIYSQKHIGDIVSKIIFHLSISTNISLYYFQFFKKKKLWCINLIDIVPFFLVTKGRNTILFSSDLYYSNFCIVCLFLLFFQQLKFLRYI